MLHIYKEILVSAGLYQIGSDFPTFETRVYVTNRNCYLRRISRIVGDLSHKS